MSGRSYLARFDGAGALMWARSFASDGYPSHIELDAEGDLFASGVFDGYPSNPDFGAGPEQNPDFIHGRSSLGIGEYDPASGALVWSTRDRGGASTHLANMGVAGGQLILGGGTGSNTSRFSLAFDDGPLVSVGRDAFVMKVRTNSPPN